MWSQSGLSPAEYYRLRAYLRKALQGRVAANDLEDFISDVFLCGCQSKTYDPAKSPGREWKWYLRGIAFKRLPAYLEFAKRRQQIHSLAAEQLDPVDAGPAEDESMIDEVHRVALRKALRASSARVRRVIEQLLRKEKTREEIGKNLGITTNAIDQMWRRFGMRVAAEWQRLKDRGD